ncbi:predicted protein [Naegleria gruberi]|uniref:Predicted protein n=1 Tax=Naegleria gruberi TaxID=5762 RepID=D2VB53_NAEGR|nr:uncharacterized protein NAEGRDRAFT_66094 [Naegleria gruberi]EFC45735.1 predicted protein [Naegleria gruberi]|eukprot:XP_002678479.1 predicted protein [Naegleria gruberi strain NEG-M]
MQPIQPPNKQSSSATPSFLNSQQRNQHDEKQPVNDNEEQDELNLSIYEEDNISTDDECHDNGISNLSLHSNHQEDETEDASPLEELNKFVFNIHAFRGELLMNETSNNATIQVYKNTNYSCRNSNFKLHDIPLIFLDGCKDNVFYCKKHCEKVYSHSNLHTTIDRLGGSTTRITAFGLSLLKKAMVLINKESNSFDTLLSNHAQQLALVSYTGLMLMANKKKNQPEWDETELSSFYKHKFIIVLKGITL